MAKTLSMMLKLTDCMHNLCIAFKERGGGGLCFCTQKKKGGGGNGGQTGDLICSKKTERVDSKSYSFILPLLSQHNFGLVC